jgi:hypothetical protein
MKTFLATLALAAAFGLTASARQTPHAHAPAAAAAPQEKAATGDVIKRGAPLGESPAVKFADVLKEPQKYAGKQVMIDGVVERVCKAEGCWMEIAPEAGGESVRVSFLNHGFFVPKDAKSMKFRAEGKFSLKTLSKEEVDHLVNDDGATVKRNADGTANEVSFVATGVELRK